jgi:hypothetical protein
MPVVKASALIASALIESTPIESTPMKNERGDASLSRFLFSNLLLKPTEE